MSPPSFESTSWLQHSLLDRPGSRSLEREAEGELPLGTISIRSVLACLDGSEFGRGVVSHAQLVARSLGAELTLLRVLEPQRANGAMPEDCLDWDLRHTEARNFLERHAAGVVDPHTEIRSELIQGRPAEQICSWAQRHEIDLTVLCSHGQRGLTEWELASTARKLIDHIPGSLLLVPAGVASRAEEARYRRILVPLDGSPRSESVIPVAMRIAEAQDAEVLLVHVVPSPEIMRLGPDDPEGAELETRVVEHNRRVAEAYLDRARGRIAHGTSRVRALVVGSGRVHMTLDRLIREERADLVVMSSHGRSGHIDSPCGSVTEYTLTHAATPLLVLRERRGGRMRPVRRARTRPLERPEPTSP